MQNTYLLQYLTNNANFYYSFSISWIKYTKNQQRYKATSIVCRDPDRKRITQRQISSTDFLNVSRVKGKSRGRRFNIRQRRQRSRKRQAKTRDPRLVWCGTRALILPSLFAKPCRSTSGRKLSLASSLSTGVIQQNTTNGVSFELRQLRVVVYRFNGTLISVSAFYWPLYFSLSLSLSLSFSAWLLSLLSVSSWFHRFAWTCFS